MLDHNRGGGGGGLNLGGGGMKVDLFLGGSELLVKFSIAELDNFPGLGSLLLDGMLNSKVVVGSFLI